MSNEEAKSKNVIKLADVTKNSAHWSVQDALKRALEKSEGFNKCLVLLLDTENDEYNIKTISAGLRTNEIVALLEISKQDQIESLYDWEYEE